MLKLIHLFIKADYPDAGVISLTSLRKSPFIGSLTVCRRESYASYGCLSACFAQAAFRDSSRHRGAERRACSVLIYGTACAGPHSLYVSHPDGNCGLDVPEARRVHLPREYGAYTLAFLRLRVAPGDPAFFDNRFLHCRDARARDCWYPYKFAARYSRLGGTGQIRNGSRSRTAA